MQSNIALLILFASLLMLCNSCLKKDASQVAPTVPNKPQVLKSIVRIMETGLDTNNLNQTFEKDSVSIRSNNGTITGIINTSTSVRYGKPYGPLVSRLNFIPNGKLVYLWNPDNPQLNTNQLFFDTLFVDSSKRIMEQHTRQNLGCGNEEFSLWKYSYNAEDQCIKCHFFSVDDANLTPVVKVNYYTIQEGDMIRDSLDGGNSILYDYYLEKLTPSGYLSYAQIFYGGYNTYNNKHLNRSTIVTQSNEKSFTTYVTDNFGQIIQMTTMDYKSYGVTRITEKYNYESL